MRKSLYRVIDKFVQILFYFSKYLDCNGINTIKHEGRQVSTGFMPLFQPSSTKKVEVWLE